MVFVKKADDKHGPLSHSNAGDKPWQTASLSGSQRIQTAVSERAIASRICVQVRRTAHRHPSHPFLWLALRVHMANSRFRCPRRPGAKRPFLESGATDSSARDVRTIRCPRPIFRSSSTAPKNRTRRCLTQLTRGPSLTCLNPRRSHQISGPTARGCMSLVPEPCIDMPRNSTAPAEERYEPSPCASSAILLDGWRRVLV